ncbi:vitamin K-dependent protein C-like [Diachasmimorpha longicaudata]|uniref:vitamin K-dependent protein C-like n=1 Tax=Diachasmimorpha longicaudata TaxID=58733 RepID=UPI0030B8F2D4
MSKQKWDLKEHFCAIAQYLRRPFIKDDIAVLKLDAPLLLGENIVPVELPQNDFLPYCQMLHFAGWGYTQNDIKEPLLRFMDFTIKAPNTSDYMNNVFDDRLFNAVDILGIQTPNQGDSGGPLVLNNVVYGVLSGEWADDVAAFINVYRYLDFIKTAIEL